MTRILIALALLGVCACGGGEDDSASTTGDTVAGKTAIANDSPAETMAMYASVPEIGAMSITNQSFYCSFYNAAAELDPEDPASWEFMFLTVYDGADLTADRLNGQVLLNDEVRVVELVDATVSDTGEVRRYRTNTAPIAAIELTLSAGEEGYESTQFTGSMRVIEPAGGQAFPIEGSCS